jgi:hypothetical protein
MYLFIYLSLSFDLSLSSHFFCLVYTYHVFSLSLSLSRARACFHSLSPLFNSSFTFWPYIDLWHKSVHSSNQILPIDSTLSSSDPSSNAAGFSSSSSDYTVWLATGEAAGGFLISLLGAAQTLNVTNYSPRFSVCVFFIICTLFGIMSHLAFHWLEIQRVKSLSNQTKMDPLSIQSSLPVNSSLSNQNNLTNQSLPLSNQSYLSTPTPSTGPTYTLSSISPHSSSASVIDVPTPTYTSSLLLSYLQPIWPELLIIFICNFWLNGVYYSILPNAVLPFGYNTYQWATYLPGGVVSVFIASLHWAVHSKRNAPSVQMVNLSLSPQNASVSSNDSLFLSTQKGLQSDSNQPVYLSTVSSIPPVQSIPSPSPQPSHSFSPSTSIQWISRTSISIATLLLSICMLGLLLPALNYLPSLTTSSSSNFFSFLVVLNACLLQIFFGFARTGAFLLLQGKAGNMLAGGAVTQFGSFIGSILFYYLLNCPKPFNDY